MTAKCLCWLQVNLQYQKGYLKVMTPKYKAKNSINQLQEQLVKTKSDNSEELLLKQAISLLNSQILGLVLGVVIALIIFVATNWLVIRGGEVVGPHLGLLSQFFIGYSVTFIGSIIGAVYGFIIGYLSGLLIGWIYNKIVMLKRQN